jgi:hypothetical protein
LELFPAIRCNLLLLKEKAKGFSLLSGLGILLPHNLLFHNYVITLMHLYSLYGEKKVEYLIRLIVDLVIR